MTNIDNGAQTDGEPVGCQTREELMAHLKELDKSLSVEELKETLGSTVKMDDQNKVITFLAMILTYTGQDQMNLGFLAESTTGKSYIPLELAQYFPKSDILKLGYASPTAFFHEWGELIPDPADTRDVEDEKKRKITVIDVHQKIIIFLDQPHSELLQRLRPLLSHDEKQITVKICDRTQKSGLRTRTIIIIGFPTVIICTTKSRMDDQEKTRLLLLSPEVTQEKLRSTIALRIEKESNRTEYARTIHEDQRRKFLQNRVACIRAAHINDINIPIELREKIYQQFMQDHAFLSARHQRDISRLLSIIKGMALLNFQDRDRVGDTLIANRDDVLSGYSLYKSVSEANEMGLPPEIYDIYTRLQPLLETKEDGATIKDIQKWMFREFHKLAGRKAVTEILQALETAGLIAEQPDPNDKRIMRYVPHEVGVTFPENNGEVTTNVDSKNSSTKLDITSNTLHKKVHTPTPGGTFLPSNRPEEVGSDGSG